MNMVNQAFRIKIAYRRNYGGYMRRRILRRLYEEKKKPGIGRYPMGPTKKETFASGVPWESQKKS